MRLKLPWGEELFVESDVELFGFDIGALTAEYYIYRPDPCLMVVRSTDFQLEGDLIIVRSCTVNLSEAMEDEWSEEQEQTWKDFMLFDEASKRKK